MRGIPFFKPKNKPQFAGLNFSDASGGGGGSYTLPTATASRLGGVKIGSGVNVSSDGTISVSGGSTYITGTVNTSTNTPILTGITSVKAWNGVVVGGYTYPLWYKGVQDSVDTYIENGTLYLKVNMSGTSTCTYHIYLTDLERSV